MKSILSLFMAARLWLLAAPLAFTFVGTWSNQAVLAANGGKFPVMLNSRAAKGSFGPVDQDGMMDETHCLMTKDTHLNWLGDFYNLHTHIYSPGDLMLWLGETTLSYAVVVWGTLLISDKLHRRKAAQQCAYCD